MLAGWPTLQQTNLPLLMAGWAELHLEILTIKVGNGLEPGQASTVQSTWPAVEVEVEEQNNNNYRGANVTRTKQELPPVPGM